ncbi:hypothetical protein [Spirosoma endophyticum]|uniref:hypothetical protein n=1 Tax=Spirosoma endophyticum TaxID=662367 RepID=UPI001C434AEE|nr:hypothetical protein [Spirosoma endophyticum]
MMNYLMPGTMPPTVVRFDASSLFGGQLAFSSQASLGQLRVAPRRIITVSANINNQDLSTAMRDVQAAITAA